MVPWSSDQPLKQPAGVLAFDADKLCFPFVLRSWKTGDWMIPFGMKGRKKLSDIFADLKYEATEKTAALVLEDGLSTDSSHVAALLGVRMDDRYRISASTSKVLKISIL
jgi:tRNA(Ile)-lysidine synthase